LSAFEKNQKSDSLPQLSRAKYRLFVVKWVIETLLLYIEEINFTDSFAVIKKPSLF